jgi:ferritin-like metal-binding protein YciE
MSANAQQQLVKYLTEAHAMEQQALALLDRGADIVGDEEIARIFRGHRLQTQEHERYIAERLQAHGETPSRVKDVAMQLGAVGIGMVAQASEDTPIRLATTAFAFENLEIASYRVIERLAQRAGDTATAEVAERILEEEEAAAELVAGVFDRALERSLGEAPLSPLPPVTPLGKPSERELVADHQGPQSFKGVSADEPGRQPPHVDSPTDSDQLATPGSGHPAGVTRPYDEAGSPSESAERA